MLLFKSSGLSNQSPIAFALFGTLLSTIGNIPVGHRFSLLSMALLNKLNSQDVAGEVMYVITRVKCLVEPLQALNELQTQAALASISAGDMQLACVNRALCCVNNFWTGAKLADVNKDFRQAINFVSPTHDISNVLMGNEAEVELDSLLSEQSNNNPRQLMLL
ncbi:hypothetical protein ACHAWO_006480 [Cyclotella atomus]|uniref:Uncharacterized protein n=1 Tax=Cyclotella atomus TaxID=382360 RepID=A0ABD3Q3M4_9STRA